MFQRRRRPIDYHWIAPPGRLTRACSPHLLCILRSGRTLLFLSCRAQLPPPVCQMEVPRPPGRTQDCEHGRISWRQSVAHQPYHLRRGYAICRRIQSKPRPDPRSKSYVSRPDICPSLESALKRGNPVSQRGPTALAVSQRPVLALRIATTANGRSAPILLKKSKIEGLRKSRKCRMFTISDAASLSRIDANVGDRFCANICGHSHRSSSDA
jgi:hypothetical protein